MQRNSLFFFSVEALLLLLLFAFTEPKTEALNTYEHITPELVTPTKCKDIQKSSTAPDPITSNDAPICVDNLTSLCIQVRNYPKIVESSLQEQYLKYALFFGADYTPPIVESRYNTPNKELPRLHYGEYKPMRPRHHHNNVYNRINTHEERAFCDSYERTIYPQSGLTIHNTDRWIVNHDNYTQGIRIEECNNEGKPCRMQGSFQNGYKATCRQNFSYRKLLALTKDGSIFIEQFMIPSCCKCVLTQANN